VRDFSGGLGLSPPVHPGPPILLPKGLLVPQYGWFLKHTRTGSYVHVEGDKYTAVSGIREATRFETQVQAIVARDAFNRQPMTSGIVFAIVDGTIPDAPPPDNDLFTPPSRQDLLKAAYEAGAERRARHDEARRLAKAAPREGDVLLPHPGAA
jgi:hypothetical protein